MCPNATISRKVEYHVWQHRFTCAEGIARDLLMLRILHAHVVPDQGYIIVSSVFGLQVLRNCAEGPGPGGTLGPPPPLVAFRSLECMRQYCFGCTTASYDIKLEDVSISEALAVPGNSGGSNEAMQLRCWLQTFQQHEGLFLLLCRAAAATPQCLASQPALGSSPAGF